MGFKPIFYPCFYMKIFKLLLIIEKQIWKLSADFKTFQFTDCDSNDKEGCSDSIDIERIKEVRKEDFRKPYFHLNIIYKRLDESGEQNIILACQNEEIIDAWNDGINMLINPKPTGNIVCFIECLKDTQLMDLHTLNYEIANEIPKIPDMPADFEFNLVSV